MEINPQKNVASISRNVMSLGIVLGANTLIPLITMPYLTRALGPDSFGKVSYIQAVMAFVLIFTDYAFSWSAVRDVAASRNNKQELSRLFFSTWSAQWMLTSVAYLALLGSFFIFPIDRNQFSLFNIGFVAIILGNVLFPLWFFQGLERMGQIALIQVSTRICSVPAIFIFVKTPDDAAITLGIQAGTTILAGMLSLVYIVRNRQVDIYLPNFADVVGALRTGWSLFLSKVSVSLYTTMAPLVLGLIAGTTAVSYFILADRIRAAGQSLMTPLSNALFPRLSHLFHTDRKSANKLVGRSFLLTIFAGSIVSLSLFGLAQPAVALLGGSKYEPATQVLQILAILPLVVGLSNFFGVQILLPNRRISPFNAILSIAAVAGALIIWPLCYFLGSIGAALSVVFVEIFVTAAMALYLMRNRDIWSSL